MKEAIDAAMKDLNSDTAQASDQPRISEEELRLTQEMTIPSISPHHYPSPEDIERVWNDIRERSEKRDWDYNTAREERERQERREKDFYIDTAAHELAEIRRIAEEFAEKKKAKEQSEEKRRKTLEERNCRRRAEEDNRRRTREAELLRLIKEEEERVRLSQERTRRLEEELRENWAVRASQDPDGFDSTIPKKWLDDKCDRRDDAQASGSRDSSTLHSRRIRRLGRNLGKSTKKKTQRIICSFVRRRVRVQTGGDGSGRNITAEASNQTVRSRTAKITIANPVNEHEYKERKP